MSELKIKKSIEDVSVNFIFGKEQEYLEARYVRRIEDYIVCYVSIKKGCSKACKFCHLTTTNQISEEEATLEEILMQAREVKKYYDEEVRGGRQKKARIVHFNFMARGEPLDSKVMLEQNQELFLKMSEIFNDLRPKFNVSTIFPKKLKGRKLTEIFGLITPTIYYSLYSTNKDFRNEWMPQADNFDNVLQNLKEYQEDTKKIVKLHQTLISGVNDSIEDAINIANKVLEYKLIIEFQIVRYNPYSEEEGKESSDEQIEIYLDEIRKLLPNFKVKILNRVGHDVNASCGMFYN